MAAAFLVNTVAPYLSASAPEKVRKNMLSAASDLVYLTGWMAMYEREHGLGQRYYMKALKLAGAAEDHVTPERTAAYWGHGNVSDWQPGSAWEHRRADGTHAVDVVGTVLEATPPTRLVSTWALPGGEPPQGPSRVTFGIEEYGEIARLTVTHENLADEAERAEAARGWAAVLSNLKTFLETGRPLPKAPWLMP